MKQRNANLREVKEKNFPCPEKPQPTRHRSHVCRSQLDVGPGKHVRVRTRGSAERKADTIFSIAHESRDFPTDYIRQEIINVSACSGSHSEKKSYFLGIRRPGDVTAGKLMTEAQKPNDQKDNSEDRIEQLNANNRILRSDISNSDHEAHTADLRSSKRESEKKRKNGDPSISTGKYFKGQRLGLYDGTSQLVPENREAAIAFKESGRVRNADQKDSSMSDEFNSKDFKQLLNEKEREALKHYCERVSMDAADIAEIRKELKVSGLHIPENKILALVDAHRVICFGESHAPGRNWLREFGANLMPDLKRHGITHLALEQPVYRQSDIDEFQKEGKLSYPEDQDYLNLMKKAAECGIKLIAVDSSNKAERDKHMADMIERILADNEQNKVLFWVGAGHATHSSPGVRTCLDILDQNIGEKNTVSVFGPSLGTDFINTITPDVQKSMIIDISKTARLAGAPTTEASMPAHFGGYDYVMIESRDKRSYLP